MAYPAVYVASLYLCFAFASLSGVLAEDIAFSLVVQRQLVNLDGYTRDAVTVNGNYLGPTIEATVGDRVMVTATNKLLQQEVLSMHFHGVKQVGTPWADGTAFISNCPITFGSSYTYNFTANEPGTFWYHAHVGSLGMEGSSGMIVIYDRDAVSYPSQTRSKFGSFDYDAELRIVLSDWYHPSVYTLNAMIEHNPFQWVGNGDSILINGKGESKLCSYNGSTTMVTTTQPDGTQSTTTSTCKGNREVFALQRDKTYLVRIVNTANLAFFNLAVAGHYFTMLGVDGGSFTTPVDVNSVDLSSGQRYMALLRYNDSAAGASPLVNSTYLMQVQTDWRGNDVSTAGIAHAYVTYGSAAQVKQSEVSALVPPNESRGWKEWYNLVTALNTSANASVTTSAGSSGTVARACPSDSAVTKTFRLDGLQQFVDTSTGRGLTPPSKTPGTPGTRLAWTVYQNARMMMPATPYLLTSYMASHLNYTSTATTASEAHGTMEMHGRLLSERDHSDERLVRHDRGSLAHKYWDSYPIITPTAGPGDNIATANIARASRAPSGPHVTASADMLQPLRIDKDDVVDIVVQTYASVSGGCDLHPWHLHGHSFWLIARGSGLYDAETSYSQPDTMVSPLPLKVDTVSGYPSNYSDNRADVMAGTAVKGAWRDPCGWFKIRFVADNPGNWRA
jgi:FtsP/CotA-like multicopper oxidase with cupredoxin domain